jgi:hypothetical protein
LSLKFCTGSTISVLLFVAKVVVTVSAAAALLVLVLAAVQDPA